MSLRQFKIVSWNVNGYRAILKKNFIDVFNEMDADIFALQETKIQQYQLSNSMKNIRGYNSKFSCSALKKGYSGVAVYFKRTLREVNKGILPIFFNEEGRVIQIFFEKFIFFCVYFPNGQMSLERLNYKLNFYNSFFNLVEKYRKKGYSIVIVGDFNIAHNDIDLKYPLPNSKRSGFLRIERDWIDKIIKKGYVDTFRYLYPDVVKYSWWSYRFKARENNVGWRIDYCFVSEDIIKKGHIKDAFICSNIVGSDHSPIGITLNI